jgi:hypothetical protein
VDVASLPARKPRTSLSDSQTQALIEALGRGEHPYAVAKRLHPTNRKAQRRVRRKLEASLIHDPRVAAGVFAKARITLLAGLGPATEGLVRQARRRPDAVKLLLEATGLHNPKMQHEHSGEIKIKLDMPRPKFVDAEVTDAEVVEPS